MAFCGCEHLQIWFFTKIIKQHNAKVLQGAIMNIDNTLLQLVSDFRSTLDNHLEQLKCFCNRGVQVEGWLKGEMLFFLGEEVKRSVIEDFDREVRINDKNGKRHVVDLKIVRKSPIRHDLAYVELKHWLIGYQKNTRWFARSYMTDNSSVGISLDAKRLQQISRVPNYLFILATANPGTDDWNKGIEIFNTKFTGKIDPLTTPKDFPDEYFIGLLKVEDK
jgi:hypothetical protein